MTTEEFILNLMENDTENIQFMTTEQAADILSWTRADDEKGEIPENLTAEELARLWNEKKGTTRKTVFNVYKRSAEIHYKNGKRPEVDEKSAVDAWLNLLDDSDIVATFDNIEDARAFLKKDYPVMSITEGHWGIRFLVVEGEFIAEEEFTYDADGEEIDYDFIGTWECSILPEESKFFRLGDRRFDLTAVRYRFRDEIDIQHGILLHDWDDANNDGDTLYGNGWTLDDIQLDEDMENLLNDTCGTTYFHKGDDGIYTIDA